MSFYFGTQNELLYSYFGNGTPLATFTTEDNLQKTFPAVVIPGGYFANAGTRTSCIRILAQGVMGSTASPTFTFSIRRTSVTPPAWAIGGTALGTTGALTAANAAAQWRLEAEIGLQTLSVGAASTVKYSGKFECPAGIVSPFSAQWEGTDATWETDLQYFLWLSAACNASSGSNTLTLQSLRVYGED